MPNYATATIIGHLGQDATTRSTNTNKTVFNTSLAVNTGYGDNKRTTWWRVNAFGKTAETLERLNLAKGAAIGFTGQPFMRTWTDKDGNKRETLELNVSDFVLLGKPDAPAAQVTQVSASPQNAGASDVPFDDEIPF